DELADLIRAGGPAIVELGTDLIHRFERGPLPLLRYSRFPVVQDQSIDDTHGVGADLAAGGHSGDCVTAQGVADQDGLFPAEGLRGAGEVVPVLFGVAGVDPGLAMST